MIDQWDEFLNHFVTNSLWYQSQLESRHMADSEGEVEHNIPLPLPKDTLSPPSRPLLNTITSLPHLITVKLTNQNYLLWKSQMIPYLPGWHLYGYINGSTRPPPLFLEGTSFKTNLVYDHWVQKDQLILGTLISSLFEPLIAQVIGLTTSQTFCQILENLFASTTQARLGQLHNY